MYSITNNQFQFWQFFPRTKSTREWKHWSIHLYEKNFSSSHMRPTFSNLMTTFILHVPNFIPMMHGLWTYCHFKQNYIYSSSVHILWTVNMWRLKLNTRLNTIWPPGHLVCPWCKLLWCVRESWRPNFFPQSLQTNLRGSAWAVRIDDPIHQWRLSCTAHLATKGEKHYNVNIFYNINHVKQILWPGSYWNTWTNRKLCLTE